MDQSTELGGMIFVAGIMFVLSILFFLIAREIVCWYWKINAALELMRGIDAKLAVIAGNTQRVSASEASQGQDSRTGT